MDMNIGPSCSRTIEADMALSSSRDLSITMTSVKPLHLSPITSFLYLSYLLIKESSIVVALETTMYHFIYISVCA